jgi:hypothetical protein
MRVRIEERGREPMKGEAADYGAVRDMLFAYQQHTEATDLVAIDDETGERIARVRFEWLEA